MIIVGALFTALIWGMRMIFDNDIFLYVSVFFMGLFTILVMVPLDSNIYEKGEAVDALHTSMFRNIFSMSSRILLFGAMLILLNFFEVSFATAIGGLMVLIAVNLIAFTPRQVKELGDEVVK